jgi:Peptidase U49
MNQTERREESSCDEFATRFLPSDVDTYAVSQGVDSELVRQKREIGIYFALFAIALLAKERCGESDSHPPVAARIYAAFQITGRDEIGVSPAIAHTAFAAVRMIWPGAPGPFKPPGMRSAAS